MMPTTPKFGVRFLTRKERTVRRVTKCETREIKKRLEPAAISLPTPIKAAKPRTPAPARPKPATLVKVREPQKLKPMTEASSNEKEQVEGTVPSSSPPANKAASPCAANRAQSSLRTLQTNDLQKLSRLSCSREFGHFHKEIKCELRTSEHQLAFLQTKLYHLKNEFVDQNSELHNLEQIRNYFAESLQKNIDRRIKPDEFITLFDKLKQDIKQAIDKWLKKKEPGKQNRAISDYVQKRQSRIRELIKETIEETKKQRDASQENCDAPTMDNAQDQSPVEELCID